MMGTEKRQILIVDDVELNRAILAELFQDSYEVFEAENGCQALELLEAHHDDILIVLLDIIMPVMDGFEMLQNMAHRTWKEEIPVVLITSENSDNALLKGYELGVSDIINSAASTTPSNSTCTSAILRRSSGSRWKPLKSRR